MTNSSIPGPNNITRVELDNGIVVLVYENFAAQSVVIAGSLEAGSIYEDTAKGGTASMTASALMRGTKNRDFDAIHSSLEDIGADLDFGAGTHTTGFSGKALAEDLPVLLGHVHAMRKGDPPFAARSVYGEDDHLTVLFG